MARSKPLKVLGLLFPVGAPALGGIKVRRRLAARVTLGWPSTGGQLLEPGLDAVRSTSRRRTTVSDLASLRDTCAVDGRACTGDRLFGGFSSTDPARAGSSSVATRFVTRQRPGPARAGSSCAPARGARSMAIHQRRSVVSDARAQSAANPRR